jgi:hypothetical protein
MSLDKALHQPAEAEKSVMSEFADVEPVAAEAQPNPFPPLPKNWVAFEQGKWAHILREDDLFPAERTLCGKPAIDADLQALPRFNSFPADYLLCRTCCRVWFGDKPLPSLTPRQS